MRPANQRVSKQPRTRKTVSRLISHDSRQPQRPDGTFREIVEGLAVGVATCTPNGTMLWVNGRFTEILGIPYNIDPLGSRLHNFITPHSWHALDDALRVALKEAAEGDLKIATESGRPRKVLLKLAPVQAETGTIIQLVAAEPKISQAADDLKKSEASLHSLSGRLLRLQDEERRRIARDLHDITGQELAVVVMSLSHLARTIGEPEVDANKQIMESVEIIRKIEQEVRTLSYLLHPPLLDELGLVSALGWYVEGFNKRTGLAVRLVAPSDFGRLAPEKETALFRVVQEGLTNVLRHSGSQRARIELSSSDSDVRLTVEDEGKGVSKETLRKVNGPKEILGVGIPGIRERLRQFGGSLKVQSSSRGTVLTAFIPAARETAVAEAPILETPVADQPAQAASENQERKRILIVDDHEMIRHGIRALLATHEDIEVCGEAADGIEAMKQAEKLNPDLIIMDLSLPHLGGLGATYQIKKTGNPARVLVFTTHDFNGLEGLAEKAGCDGVVLKRKANQDLIRGVRAVLSGKTFFNQEKGRAASA